MLKLLIKDAAAACAMASFFAMVMMVTGLTA